MAPETAIAARIQAALAEYLKRDASAITPSHSLRDDLGLDSMATIELLFRIEEAFDLQIPDEDLHRLITVADVIAYVERAAPSTGVATTRAAAAKKPVKPAAKRPPAKRKG